MSKVEHRQDGQASRPTVLRKRRGPGIVRQQPSNGATALPEIESSGRRVRFPRAHAPASWHRNPCGTPANSLDQVKAAQQYKTANLAEVKFKIGYKMPSR